MCMRLCLRRPQLHWGNWCEGKDTASKRCIEDHKWVGVGSATPSCTQEAVRESCLKKYISVINYEKSGPYLCQDIKSPICLRACKLSLCIDEYSNVFSLLDAVIVLLHNL